MNDIAHTYKSHIQLNKLFYFRYAKKPRKAAGDKKVIFQYFMFIYYFIHLFFIERC